MADPDDKTDIGLSFIAIVLSILVCVHSFAVWFRTFKSCKRCRRKKMIKKHFSLAEDIRLAKKFRKGVQSTKRLRKSKNFAQQISFESYESSSVDSSGSSSNGQSSIENHGNQLNFNHDVLVPSMYSTDVSQLNRVQHMNDQDKSVLQSFTRPMQKRVKVIPDYLSDESDSVPDESKEIDEEIK